MTVADYDPGEVASSTLLRREPPAKRELPGPSLRGVVEGTSGRLGVRVAVPRRGVAAVLKPLPPAAGTGGKELAVATTSLDSRASAAASARSMSIGFEEVVVAVEDEAVRMPASKAASLDLCSTLVEAD